MAITAVCSACGQRFQAPDSFNGKRVKCKACGEIFVVRDPSAAEDEPLEVGSASEAASAATKQKSPFGDVGRIGPKNEKRIAAPTGAEEIPFKDSETITMGRPNVLIFDFPGAWKLDQWLPLGLILLGIAIYAIFGSQQDGPVKWISGARFVVAALCYWLIVTPITLLMLRKAAASLNYQLPPQVKLRTFSAYMPAFALAAGMWLVSDGVSTPMIFSILLGIGLSSTAVWILFRLQEPEIPTTVGFGAGGFAMGAAASVVALLIINLIASLIVSTAKIQPKVPYSPFGAGFAWVAPPPEPAPVKPVISTPPGPAVVVAPAPPGPTSAVASFETDKIPGPLSEIITPLSGSSVIAVVKKSSSGAITVDPWDTQSWQQLPGSLPLPAEPQGRFVINTNGQRLAWIAQFPRLSVQVWSFSSATVAATIDLDKSKGEPRLIGFTSANNLLVEWLPTPDSASAEAAKPAPPPVTAPDSRTVVGSRVFEGTSGDSAPPPPAPTAVAPEVPKPPTTEPAIPLTMELLSIPAHSSLLQFKVPPFAAPFDTSGGRAVLAISTSAQRMVTAAKTQNSPPTLFQYDLSTGTELPSIKISEIDPTMSPAPTGLAYSKDGKRLAVMFEHAGSALLLTYESATGKKIGNGFVYPSGPLDGTPHDPFPQNAISWLDPSPYWLVYGTGLLNTQTGQHVRAADFSVPHVIGQRVLDGDRIELLTGDKDSRQVTIATLDRAKLDAAGNPPATQP